MAGGVVHIPWYATFFRGDAIEDALAEIGPIALRYGASDFQVERSNEDRYRFLHSVAFEEKVDFERFWHGPEMIDFRTRYSSFFVVPIIYEWWERVASGAIPTHANGEPAAQSVAAPANGGNGNGANGD
jgi:hypothetical protein